jgi:molybdenum cofactor cytidylyltransferase
MLGEVKPLLRNGPMSFLAHATKELLASEIDELIVVTGASHLLLHEELDRYEFTSQGGRFRTTHNPEYRDGMLSSIQVGVSAASPNTDAFLICLVDQPFLNRYHFNQMVAAFNLDAGRHGLFRPAWQGMVGNPALISRRYKDDLLSALVMDRGCSFLFEQHEDDVKLIELDDDAPLLDIDSPIDYERLIGTKALKAKDERP